MTLAELLRSGQLADEAARLARELHAHPASPRHVAVLGTAPGQGVTTVAAHLAAALCRSDLPKPVLLVDANLQRPTLTEAAGLAGAPGLRDWNLEAPLPTQRWDGLPGVELLGAGGARPTGPVGSAERLLAACRRARVDHAVSVWDVPAVRDHGEGLDLAAACDGAIVVIELDAARVDALQYLRSALERRQSPILGSVLNRAGRYWLGSQRARSLQE